MKYLLMERLLQRYMHRYFYLRRYNDILSLNTPI